MQTDIADRTTLSGGYSNMSCSSQTLQPCFPPGFRLLTSFVCCFFVVKCIYISLMRPSRHTASKISHSSLLDSVLQSLVSTRTSIRLSTPHVNRQRVQMATTQQFNRAAKSKACDYVDHYKTWPWYSGQKTYASKFDRDSHFDFSLITLIIALKQDREHLCCNGCWINLMRCLKTNRLARLRRRNSR